MKVENIDVTGLECEEALACVRLIVRRKSPEQVIVTSKSSTFLVLLTRWADNLKFEMAVMGQSSDWRATVSVGVAK